ncbi:hypothetical protein HQ308_19945 [Rhodococcus sp. BP-241]|uniref:restriction system modified-DNA reader domain-containing protein n=1 Tax=Rhodococcus sp. BP-241 TaxID=2739441 RepID=UPI001C9A9323|nr:hypothetical protein [Rhodococcus sp. BP-241]MBY6709067.1 hypothetical protein [Rhodococcus sp. BP-241]
MIEREADLLPVTVLLPETAADPIVMYDAHAALRLAVVEQAHVRRLGLEWNRPGNYVLLDPVDAEGKWGCYVGMTAPGGIRTRLLDHLTNKDHWRRALLIQRDTTHSFNSAQVAWVEGRLYDLLNAAENAQLHNKVRPVDETLPAFDRATLEACVLPISRVLRLLGHDPATADESGVILSQTGATRTSRFQGITVFHLLQAGMLSAGTKLTSTNGAWPASAEVLSDGRIEFASDIYPTPSAAGKAAKDGGAVNGWDFWAVDEPSGRTTLATLRARYSETAAAANTN